MPVLALHRGILLACAVPVLATLGAGAAAQPVLNLAVSGAHVLSDKSCAVVKVAFNIRVRYAGHFPLGQGDEVKISVQAIDPDQLAILQHVAREGVRLPEPKLAAAAALKAIVFERDQPAGPVLRIQFDRPVAYQVAAGADFQSIVVAVAGAKPSVACTPVFPASPFAPSGATRTLQANAGAVPGTRIRDRIPGQVSEAEQRIVAGRMDEARAAMRKNNLSGAMQILLKLLALPENPYSAEAQELLALARQKNGQLDEARAEYADYLQRYPKGEGSERVRQRLAGLVTATGPAAERLRPAGEQIAEKRRLSRFAPPGETVWSISGSASQFYIRDDSFDTVKDASIAPNLNADPDAHRVHQDMMLSSLDLIATWANDRMQSKVRFSGTNELSMAGDNADRFGVAALFAEASLMETDVMGRIGRQTRNTGGVIGRFDGALASWQATPDLRLNVVGGSPNISRFDMPFKNDKYFYGVSADIGPLFGGIDTTLFAIEQRDRSFIDRQAVGAEFRYFTVDKSALATIDYDVHFNQLNAAIFSGSWTLPDKSTVTAGLDYRKVPYLSVWTALQGQPFLTLYDMLRIHTNQEVDQLAIDRTPTYRSAMVGYSRPITDKLSVSADVTATDVSGTIASGGVDGTIPIGVEYYFATQLIGTGIFRDGDVFTAAARYADLSDSNLYVLDFNSRYPLNDAFRLAPRLRLGYRTGKGTDLKEYTVLPSFLIDYYWTKDLSLELEIGTKWTWSELAGIKTNQTDLFLTLGVRYDFYADGKSKYPAGGKAN